MTGVHLEACTLALVGLLVLQRRSKDSLLPLCLSSERLQRIRRRRLSPSGTSTHGNKGPLLPGLTRSRHAFWCKRSEHSRTNDTGANPLRSPGFRKPRNSCGTLRFAFRARNPSSHSRRPTCPVRTEFFEQSFFPRGHSFATELHESFGNRSRSADGHVDTILCSYADRARSRFGQFWILRRVPNQSCWTEQCCRSPRYGWRRSNHPFFDDGTRDDSGFTPSANRLAPGRRVQGRSLVLW